ncbi:MAG TPA: hypothetical protein VGC64_10935 [Pyrinomonadaceae bacterium]
MTKSKGMPLQKEGSGQVILAVRKENRLELVKEPERVMRAMQRAFEKIQERETVREVKISTSDKFNYLAVSLVDQSKNNSTLFFDLVPVSEGSAFHTVGPHVVTCVKSGNCNGTCIVIAPNTNANPSPSPHCDCFEGNTLTRACNFKINKVYITRLQAAFKAELVADGFETGGDGSTPVQTNPKVNKTPATPRPTPKRGT